MASTATHEVLNQSPVFEDVDLFALDRPLQDALAAQGGVQDGVQGGGVEGDLSGFGRLFGSAVMAEAARAANTSLPQLRAFDAKGHRCDQVVFHPAYHHVMARSIAAHLHCTWQADGTAAPAPTQVMRAARFYMAAQVEQGHLCPITMTRAGVAALAAEPALRARLMPKLVSRTYDCAFAPLETKAGITLGMGMTEKQGGTDVRANTTRALAAGDGYLLTGHKWFLSAPMCDAFLVLAQAPGGLTCFLLPRFRPDGTQNALILQRLKDKLGNRSNASAEVEFADAFAFRVGPEGAGVRTILAMVQLTRLDCAIASAGFMRMGLTQALHHCRHRSVFQRRLADQPMMRSVLADLGLQVEAAVALVMRLCRSFDQEADAAEAARARLLTPVVKYWVCKTAPAVIAEAMECLGGNGYVEDSVLPRLYREAPVNAIWEGSGNVMALDVLRVLSREAAVAQGVVAALETEVAGLTGMAEHARALRAALARPSEALARGLIEGLAVVAAAAALAESAPRVAEIFARLRPRNAMFGAAALDPAETQLLLERALPMA